MLGVVLVCFSSVSRSHHIRPKELERSFLQKLDRKGESQHHFKCATEALQVLMRQIFEDPDISAEIKLATGSEITVHLQLLLNIQSHRWVTQGTSNVLSELSVNPLSSEVRGLSSKVDFFS